MTFEKRSSFIGSGQGPFVTLEQNGLWQSL